MALFQMANAAADDTNPPALTYRLPVEVAGSKVPATYTVTS